MWNRADRYKTRGAEKASIGPCTLPSVRRANRSRFLEELRIQRSCENGRGGLQNLQFLIAERKSIAQWREELHRRADQQLQDRSAPHANPRNGDHFLSPAPRSQCEPPLRPPA